MIASPAKRRGDGIALFALTALALIIFQPWHAPALQLVDLSEALPYFQQNSSAVDRISALVRHYARDWGRFNPVLLAWYAAQWSAFADRPLGWQLVAFLLMLGNTIGAYALLRRLRASVVGAFCGAVLFVISAAVMDPWVLGLYYGEPIVVALVLSATWIASGYEETPRPALSAIGICACLVGALYAKEIAIACLPFVLTVALATKKEDGWRLVRLRLRSVALVAATTVVVVVAMFPILSVRANAPLASYGARYSVGSFDPRVATMNVESMFLPFARPMGNASLSFLDVSAVLVLIVGVVIAVRRRPSITTAVFAALLLPLAGAAIYLPWYYSRADYALPFLFGMSMLSAIAADGFASTGAPPTIRRFAVAVGLAIGIIVARRSASHTAIVFQQRAGNGAVRDLVVNAARGHSGSALYAVDAGDELKEWFTIRARKVAEIAAYPATLTTAQISCDAAGDSVRAGTEALVVAGPGNCEASSWPRPPDLSVVERSAHLSFWRMSIQRDSVVGRAWLPEAPRQTRQAMLVQ